MSIKKIVVIFGGAGLITSGTVLVLLGFGVSGVLILSNGINLKYVLFPMYGTLLVTWRTTPIGIIVTAYLVAFNCTIYIAVGLALSAGLCSLAKLYRYMRT